MPHRRTPEAWARRRKEQLERYGCVHRHSPTRVSTVWRGNGSRAKSQTPKWIKGLFPPARPSYGPDWPQQRYKALRRDNFTCRHEGCGETENLHVHHIIPLSEIDKKYKVYPVKDLIPVCPNCHFILHSKVPAYSLDDIRDKVLEV